MSYETKLKEKIINMQTLHKIKFQDSVYNVSL